MRAASCLVNRIVSELMKPLVGVMSCREDTGIGRKNETEIKFSVLLQIIWDISNLMFTVYTSCS